ncbi:hypothetical protein SNEBB_010119 [Seison nebaliae]|nr:hypothetical protein SNEBB_010119 [Seison nebaliae]
MEQMLIKGNVDASIFAFYNCLYLCGTVLFCLLLYGVIYVFQLFIRPLIFSLLTAFVLQQLKTKIYYYLRSILMEVEENNASTIFYNIYSLCNDVITTTFLFRKGRKFWKEILSIFFYFPFLSVTLTIFAHDYHYLYEEIIVKHNIVVLSVLIFIGLIIGQLLKDYDFLINLLLSFNVILFTLSCFFVEMNQNLILATLLGLFTSFLYNKQNDQHNKLEKNKSEHINKSSNGTLTTNYIKQLFLLYLSFNFWSEPFLFYVLAISIGTFIVIMIGNVLRTFFQYIFNQSIFQNLFSFFSIWNYPGVINFFNGIDEFHTKINYAIAKKLRKSFLLHVISIFLIISMLLFILIIGIFAAFHIHRETGEVIIFSSNVINEGIKNNSFVESLLPKESNVTDIISNVVDQIHTYGRSYLGNQLRNFLHTENQTEINLIEHRLLIIWDRLYDYIILQLYTTEKERQIYDTDISGPYSVKLKNHQNIYHISHKSIMWTRNFNSIFFSMKDELFSVLNWKKSGIINENYEVFLYWHLFGLSNGLIDNIQYEKMKSDEKNCSLNNMLREWWNNQRNDPESFLYQIQRSISGIFTTLLKMGTFYALFTWLTHSLIDLQLIFFPTILATVLSVCPMIGTYWVCLPGVLEIWLIRKNGFGAIMFFIIGDHHHPYLVGLSFASGLYIFGIEGIIIGPILLSVLTVTWRNMSRIFQ